MDFMLERRVHALDCPVAENSACCVSEIKSRAHGPGKRADFYTCEHGYLTTVIVTGWVPR